ncbi:MAG: hypothetical protein M1818_004718 [Claussenomyces sp. TS43310]|nr:MAG: hypothetical protein M1818_004718 [Claussenomyces sp. TS43310]
MADTVERLRALLGETDVWGEPEEPLEPSLVPEPEVEVAENIYSDSEEEIPLSKSIFNTANTASMKPLEGDLSNLRRLKILSPGLLIISSLVKKSDMTSHSAPSGP